MRKSMLGTKMRNFVPNYFRISLILFINYLLRLFITRIGVTIWKFASVTDEYVMFVSKSSIYCHDVSAHASRTNNQKST